MSRRTPVALLALAASLALAGCGARLGTGGLAEPGAPTGPPSATLGRAAVLASPVAPASQPTRTPAPNPCAGNHARRLVRVSIRQQHLWMCAGPRLAYSTPVTTGAVGAYTSTPTGNYRIQGRNRDTVLTLNTGATYPVRYWIPFDAPLFGFHDSSWQHFPYGSPLYRTRGSHGCVHMPLRAIAFLYRWAEVGAHVSIRA